MASAQTAEDKCPRYTRFTQQELPALRPLLTPGRVVTLLIAIGTVFVPIGAACLVASASVVELKVRYDQTCFANTGAGSMTNTQRQGELWKAGTEGETCNLRLKVTDDMDAPIYVYYEMSNFYQNHRRIAKSVSATQLRSGEKVEDPDECAPALYIDNNKTLGGGEEVLPCGLRAATYFNDSFALEIAGEEVEVSSKGIAFKSDVDVKYTDKQARNFNVLVNGTGDYRLGGTIDGRIKDDERFIVWMRTAALPSFRKLWGKISNRSFKKGEEIVVTVNNRYNSYGYGGEKALVLSTASWLGGRNSFLGIAYVAVGAVCYVSAGTFVALFVSQRREFGDLNRLSWVVSKNAQGS